MSRSWKKNAIIKDRNPGSKAIGSRKMRRKAKNKLRVETVIDEDLILPEDKSEVMNDYDVSDYKFGVLFGNWLGLILKGKNKKLNK